MSFNLSSCIRGEIVLDRPKALNACNHVMAKHIAEAAAGQGAVLLRGEDGGDAA